MRRSLLLWGHVIMIVSAVAYLAWDWDVISVTSFATGLSMALAHLWITRSWRGPTVPRE